MKLLYTGIFKRVLYILTWYDINFNTIDLNTLNSNKTFEICATKHQNNKNCMLHIQKLPVVFGSKSDHGYVRRLERQITLG